MGFLDRGTCNFVFFIDLPCFIWQVCSDFSRCFFQIFSCMMMMTDDGADDDDGEYAMSVRQGCLCTFVRTFVCRSYTPVARTLLCTWSPYHR